MNNIFRKTKRLGCILTVISIAMLTFTSIPATSQVLEKKTKVVISDAVVLEWNEIAYNRMPSGPPFPTLRYMSTIQLAVFEAVNAITGKYQPYLGTIDAPAGASPEAAAIMAAHDTLTAFFGQSTSLDNLRDASLGAIPDGQDKIDGISVGEAAAAAMIANRTGDGSAPAMFYTPTTYDPYEWQLTPGPCAVSGAGVFKHWPNVRTFGIESSSQFRAAPPPELGSGVYAHDFNEVQRVGGVNASLENRPADRTDVARLYAVTGIGTINSLLQQIAITRNDEITDTARTLAVLNMAVADASISVFDSKYYYTTWRPVTAIPRAAEDGNKRTEPSEFAPLIGTPCFPGYPSAHGANTNSALTILERAYGRFGHSLTVSHPSGLRPDGSPIVLTYSDLRDIISDVSDARVYGGIHFRFDQVAGEKQGERVGKYIYNHSLRKSGRE